MTLTVKTDAQARGLVDASPTGRLYKDTGIAMIRSVGAELNPASMNIDLMDPEALLAFFGLQMKDVRGQLAVAMQEQQERNGRIKALGDLEGMLAKFTSGGVSPGTPQWDQFAQVAEKARELLGDLAAPGTPIGNYLAQVEIGPTQTLRVANKEEAVNYVNARKDVPGAKAAAVEDDDGWTVVTNGPLGLSDKDAQGLQMQVKSLKDSFQADNSMNMIRIQQLVEQSSQITNLCSNIMKKLNDLAMAPINNMR